MPAVFLSVALLISYGIWMAGGWVLTTHLRTVFGMAVVIFVAHAVEEFLAGFQHSLPQLFGRPAWSDARFLAFNSVWAIIFGYAAAAVRPGRAFPVLIILFFAIAGGVGNGVLHLLLVIQRGEYFPGALTAPLCLVIGIVLLRLLYSGGRTE